MQAADEANFENDRLRRPDQPSWITWTKTAGFLTICIPELLLERFIQNDKVRRAWREKVALCMIIGAIMALVVWFVALMKPQICSESPSMPFLSSDGSVPYRSDQVMVRGAAYNYDQVKLKLESLNVSNFTADFINRDISRVFRERVDPCQEFSKSPESICKVRNKIPGSPDFEPGCLDISILDSIPSQTLTFEWEQLTETRGSLLVFDSYVMNLTEFFSSDYISDFKAPVGLHPIFPVGADITHASAKDFDKLKFAHCLQSKYSIGKIGSASLGCSVYAALSVSALVAVMGVILIRFIMAFAFHWIMASKLVSNKRTSKPKPNNEVGYLKMPLKDVAFFSQKDDPADTGPIYQKIFDRSYSLPTDLYTICMVTCYSEDEISIRSTLDSIAGTSYPDDKKLLFVICDGLIQGAGNSQTTPDIVVSLITQEPQFSSAPAPMSYLAIADGVKQHNMAQVYAGKYFYRQKPVPIIVVVKCGTEQERAPSAHKTKPGNRGKRDSQLILMHFLSRVTFDDRMTALDYDLFRKIQVVTNGVTADKYELLLMVDADTVVKHDSLRFMVQSMVNDDQIMGLCGETRIANKMQSWVTMIQVYEYFTNHNLGKSFESMFGGVTCLPGCFCMYRIKSKKLKTNEIVPLLVNPDVVECYSENVVDTLHKKNLLLLGEDRFLSTLMLATFSKRKMIFVPQAICHTTVPHTYKMLQSQRRRWINSTIHNLLELVMLPNLCGTFCLSMSFVIGLELFGTVSLPVAVVLTFYLIFSTIFTGVLNLVPLLLLLITLFLPALLVLLTTKKAVYALWMFVYLLAIPIWNFALPLYAFWHFDDFSWGDTRRVHGEISQADHSTRQGAYEIGSVSMKRWQDWEAERRINETLPLPPIPEQSYMSIEPSFHMDTSDINSKEDIEVQPVLNTKWKIVAVSNSKSENLKPMPVSHQGSLAKITSSLSGDEDDDGNSDKKEEKLERPKTAFYIPEQKLLMEQGEITAIPTRKNPFNSLPPPLPPRPATQTAPIFASSTNNNGINPPFSAAVQKSVVPQVLQPSTIQNLGKEKEIRLRKPPSLAKLEARKATQDDSKPTSLQNVNTESSLPLRPGNTINQYWKKLYYDQAEQYSQQITPTDMSTSVSGQSSSVASRVGEPVLSSTTTAYKAQHMQPPELVVPTPVIAKPQYEIRTLSPKTSLPPTAINLPILENNISFADSLESFAQLDLSHDDASDSVGSSDSFATARQYQSATSLTPEYLISSNPESSEVSASHSVVQGPRPQPWDDVEFGDFNIDKDAKTSTTTKAFRNMMKKDTISKIFKSAFQKNVVVPLENESYNQSQLQDLSRNTNSRLLGSRVFVEDQSSLDHSNRTSQSHTSSRVRGPRPPKF